MKQNSICYLRAVLSHTRSVHKHRDMFQTERHTELIPLSCLPAFKIHTHGGLWLCRNTGNISVLNHEDEPVNFSHIQKVKVKTDGVF